MASNTQVDRITRHQLGQAGIPRFTTGKTFYVDDSGSDSGAGSDPGAPFATFDFAIGNCTANQGDIIYLMPGHAETTSAIALDVAGVTVVGLGIGRQRPTITASTASSDLVDVTAANCAIENVRFVGAASGVTAIVDVAAADFHLIGCQIDTGAAPVDVITVASGDRGVIKGCTFLGTAAGPDNAVIFEGHVTDWLIQGNIFNYLRFDIDENIIDVPANACPGLVVADNLMLGVGAVAITIKSSLANQFAAMVGNDIVAHAASVTIADLVKNTTVGLFFSRNFGTDVAAEDAAGIPATTPA